MAVLIEALSVVVRIFSLEAKFPGGARAYERACPNATFCRDEHITRVGFMVPADVEGFVSGLRALGLKFIKDDVAQEIVVVDQFTGPTAPCTWFAGGRHVEGYSMGWLQGSAPGPLSAPAGWTPAQSRHLKFVASSEAEGRLLPLGTTGGLDVVLDFTTGREVCIGRPDPPLAE
jgi:hypothetical protein